MRFVIIVALVLNLCNPSFGIWRIVRSSSVGPTRNALGERNRESRWITCLRSEFQKGIPKFNIPSLEPLEIPNLTMKLEEEKFPWTGSVKIKDLKCDGLNQWKISNRRFKIAGVFPPSMEKSLTAVFEKLKCKTKYSDLKLTYGDRIFFGSGKIEFSLNNLILKLKFGYDVLSKTVTSIDIIPSLKHVESFEITGVNFDTELSQNISSKVLRSASTFVDENANKIKYWLQDFFSGHKSEKDSLSTYFMNKCT